MADRALEYVKHVLEVKGWSVAELARRAGVSHSTINRPLTLEDWPNALSRKTLMRIVDASGINPSEYIDAFAAAPSEAPFLSVDDDDPEGGQRREVEMIPVYDVAASAGNGSLVEYEPIVDQLSFPRDYLRKITKSNPRHLAIIGVKGDSMEPTLRDDDVVMLDMSKTNLDFDGLFVIRSGDALLVKRVMRSPKTGFITILSDNKDIYPPQEHPAGEVAVIGKVLWYGRRV